jgi:phosphonate transport system substrate-binding protein
MESLRVTSCMAENADFICRQITQYIAERLKIAAEFINDIPWQERERLLDAEQIHVCWICGLPYVWKADQPVSRIELLAAPVMSGERYRNRPIYFSDVVVHRESDFETFADLRGASWVYNESRSHSGFNLVRYHLAMRGETWGYFGRVRPSGAHQRSLQMILHHKADASAIDSTVLEMECRRRPWLLSSIRVIETLGPSPIPPWVIQKNSPREIKRELRELLLQMHTDPAGIRILTAGAIARFVAVEETDYDTIRGMARQAEQVVSWPE